MSRPGDSSEAAASDLNLIIAPSTQCWLFATNQRGIAIKFCHRRAKGEGYDNRAKEKPKNADERKSKSKEIIQEQIANRAYELWLKRDCQHGFDVEDWIRAEEELKQET